MQKLIKIVGDVTAILGVGICVLTGLLRISGQSVISGFEARTLFIGGIALMVMACLAKLQLQSR